MSFPWRRHVNWTNVICSGLLVISASDTSSGSPFASRKAKGSIFLTLVAADMIFDLTLVADSIAADTSIGSTSLMAVMMSGIACDVS